MANDIYETDLFDRALKFASEAHHGTGRRGKGFPYIIHCMEAAEICATITNDQEILAAALLHDVIEDTEKTEEDIRNEFGERVARLVVGESEPDNVFDSSSKERSSWADRKKYVIARLKKQPLENKIVALGDKLSNMRAIARDFNRDGDKLWSLFHAPDPHMHEWHYRGLVDSLSDLSDTEAFQEFAALVDDVFSRAFKGLDAATEVKKPSVFRNDIFFNTVVIIEIIAAAVSGVFYAINGSPGVTGVMAIIAAGMIATVSAYKRHEKSLMKTLIGFILGVLISYLAVTIVYSSEINDVVAAPVLTVMIVFSALHLACVALFCINHMILSSSHQANARRVTFNKLLLAVQAALAVIKNIFFMNYDPSMGTAFICECVAMILFSLVVVCIEARIDAYKTVRDDLKRVGAWNRSSKQDMKDEIFGK